MNPDQSTTRARQIKWAAAAIGILIFLFIIWPFNSAPTGSRGVVTQFGKIVGIEPEGLAILPPWRKLSNFGIRAETASIDDAEGATSDRPLSDRRGCAATSKNRSAILVEPSGFVHSPRTPK